MGRKTKSALNTEPVRRGRPAARWFDVTEAAKLLGISERMMERNLRAPGSVLFSRSVCEDGVWRIHEGDLRAIMGSKVEVLFPLAAVAEIWGISYDCLWRHCKAGNVPTVRVLGMERIRESVVVSPPEFAVFETRAA